MVHDVNTDDMLVLSAYCITYVVSSIHSILHDILDPSLSAHLSQRAPRAFHFTAPGKHIRRAQAFRAKLLDKQIRLDSIQQQSQAYKELNLHDIVKPSEVYHAVEWWDQPLIKGDAYDAEVSHEIDMDVDVDMYVLYVCAMLSHAYDLQA